MLIFGTGNYFRTRKASQRGFCSHCGKFSKQSSWNGMSFFHLYFIPIIPLSSYHRVHKYCNACSNGLTFPIDKHDEITLKIKEQSAHAILALHDGEEMIENIDEEPTEAISFLEGALDWIHSSADKEFGYQLVQQLNRPECKFAEAMATAYVQMLDGDLNKSAEYYQAASRIRPEDYRGHFRLANVLVELKKGDQAIPAYQAAATLVEDANMRVSILYLLAELLMKQKRFLEASQTYDQITQLRPDLASDREFAKLVSKAKKKAGV